MPAITEPPQPASGPADAAAAIRFPPVTRDHILHCSYDYWFPKYRTSCIKSRIIPLSPEFVEYIREDGIVLADDDGNAGEGDGDDDDEEWQIGPTGAQPRIPSGPGSDSDSDSDEDDDDEPPKLPPNQRFPELHQAIKDRIAELGGAVAPKLNWSAPQDATWISPHQNTIKCTSPNDVYLLLKSSNFITHDLEHAFDACTPTAAPAAVSASASVSPPASSTTPTPTTTNPTTTTTSNKSTQPPFQPVLVLRSYFNPHTAMEFRCFVKHRNLVAISQRDLRHFDFLRSLRADVVARAAQLFNHRLRFTFPERSFAFDVYIPERDGSREDDDAGGGRGPLGRARLIDINPWAPHTDSLLFGWQELLDMEVPGPILGTSSDDGHDEEGGGADADGNGNGDEDEDDDEEDFVPELRLVEEDDQAAFNFSSPQYSAHKLPKDVVDASLAGEGGMREFAQKWREMTEYRANVANWETGGGGGGGGGGSGRAQN
ncbi:hypothetical protein SLS62_002622 [Diatrype stigma]|uniref:Cell division cycle protein 123 n=1 Tax=Diatrype stigma TaxID=117547 RepID=A0AAN9UZY1_9PEZI